MVEDSDGAILSIDEAARVAEEFLGPYTVEENGKWENIVHGPRVNRVCSGRGVRLFEHEGPNDESGKKKRPRPADDESPKPIPAVPLRAVAPGVSSPDFGTGCPASLGSIGMAAREEDRTPPAKRGAHLTAPPSPGDTSALKKTEPSREQLDVGDFEVTDICPEEESGSSNA